MDFKVFKTFPETLKTVVNQASAKQMAVTQSLLAAGKNLASDAVLFHQSLVGKTQRLEQMKKNLLRGLHKMQSQSFSRRDYRQLCAEMLAGGLEAGALAFNVGLTYPQIVSQWSVQEVQKERIYEGANLENTIRLVFAGARESLEGVAAGSLWHLQGLAAAHEDFKQNLFPYLESMSSSRFQVPQGKELSVKAAWIFEGGMNETLLQSANALS